MTVAIAVALYNGAKFIEEQLESLRLQTVPADQVVFCDDGSTDGTPDIVQNYIERYALQDKWTVYKNKANLGYAKNFYHAMELCTADIIFLCDQDDIWKADKIERMSRILLENDNISLLMCKAGVIDAEGNELHGLLISKAKETEAVTPVSLQQLFSTCAWTGMLMCVRRSFFEKYKETLKHIDAPHDLALALTAVDSDAFYVYDYVGAFHRRHTNNAAHEEHRLHKMLNLETKLRDIRVYTAYLTQLETSELILKDTTREWLHHRLVLSQQRERVLLNRSFGGCLRLYCSDKYKVLQRNSLLCDVWLLLFGDYSKQQ